MTEKQGNGNLISQPHFSSLTQFFNIAWKIRRSIWKQFSVDIFLGDWRGKFDSIVLSSMNATFDQLIET